MINTKPLREQIYEFLKGEMQSGILTDQGFIDTGEISRRLGISKTPLRDALIQLEAEGFVTIYPRRGIRVRTVTLQDIKDSYQVIGALEASVVRMVFERFTQDHVEEMEHSNRLQLAAIENREFDRYYHLNLEFHGIFLQLSDNEQLKKTITPLKQRLYDFPRRNYVKDWELQHLQEHDVFIDCIKRKDLNGAVEVIQNRHWSFDVHKKYFSQFYRITSE